MLAWIAQRIAFALLFLISAAVFGTPGHGAGASLSRSVSDSPWLNWWDSGHFIDIAVHGYRTPDQTVFYPLYPLAERVLGRLDGGNYLLAGFIISNLACLLAMLAFRMLARVDLSLSSARWALGFFTFMPTALYLAITYSESLFLMFASSALFAIRRLSWLPAGLLTALAALTRPVGLLLLIPLAMASIAALRKRPPDLATVASWALAALLPLLAVGGFVADMGLRFHSWRIPIEAERLYYGRYLDLPWVGVSQALSVMVGQRQSPGARINAAYDLAISVATGAATAVAASVRQLPTSYAAYSLAGFLALLMLPMHGYPIGEDLNGLPRFLMLLFPIWLGFAAWSEHHLWRRLLVIAGCGLGFTTSVMFFGHAPILM